MTLETLEDGSFGVEGGCDICRDEVVACRKGRDAPRLGRREVALPEAIGAAGGALLNARAPFVYGLRLSSVETARRAARLAAALGASLDIEGSETIQADLLALQTFGLPGATFGEVRNRADVLLLWRCDPRLTQARFFSSPPGTPLSEAGARSTIVVPGGRNGASATGSGSPAGAHLLLPVRAGSDLEVILSLRALLAGNAPAGKNIGGVPVDDLSRVAGRLRSARYAAIVWSPSATAAEDGSAVAAALALLARDLNRAGRGAARPLGAGGNVAGAMAALLGATGYPRAVGFATGAARFAPGEFDASRMIGDRRTDVTLLVGAHSAWRPAAGRSGPKAGRASDAPKVIAIGPRLPEGMSDPDIWIPTALPGISAAGIALRADGVPVRLRAVLPTTRPAEEEVIEAITNQVLTRGGRAFAQNQGRSDL